MAEIVCYGILGGKNPGNPTPGVSKEDGNCPVVLPVPHGTDASLAPALPWGAV